MKCHYTFDPETKKKVFIPMCGGTEYSQDMDDCCCENPLTEYHFEKQRFNIAIGKKNNTIKCMQSEIKHLHKIINNNIKNKS